MAGDQLADELQQFLRHAGVEPDEAGSRGAPGDRAALEGERGLLAGDLLKQIRGLVNPS